MDHRIAKALELLRSGKAPSYAAKYVGTDKATFSRMFREAGLPRPRDIWFNYIVEHVDLNLSITKNAQKFNISHGTARRAMEAKEAQKCSR